MFVYTYDLLRAVVYLFYRSMLLRIWPKLTRQGEGDEAKYGVDAPDYKAGQHNVVVWSEGSHDHRGSRRRHRHIHILHRVHTTMLQCKAGHSFITATWCCLATSFLAYGSTAFIAAASSISLSFFWQPLTKYMRTFWGLTTVNVLYIPVCVFSCILLEIKLLLHWKLRGRWLTHWPLGDLNEILDK